MDEISLPIIYSKGYHVLERTAELRKPHSFKAGSKGPLTLTALFVSPAEFWRESKQRGGIGVLENQTRIAWAALPKKSNPGVQISLPVSLSGIKMDGQVEIYQMISLGSMWRSVQ